MVYTFQLVACPAPGQIQTVKVEACAPEDAVKAIEAAGMKVVNVGPGKPDVDWSKPVFTKAEAAAFLGCSMSTVERLVSEGTLPRAKDHHPIFRREDLDAVVTKRMTRKPKQT